MDKFAAHARLHYRHPDGTPISEVNNNPQAVQRLSGMRPSKGCLLGRRDIDQAADVSEYRPARHQTERRGKRRIVLLGPQARAIMATYAGKDPDAHVFDPRDAVARLHAERAGRRVTRYYVSRLGWQ